MIQAIPGRGIFGLSNRRPASGAPTQVIDDALTSTTGFGFLDTGFSATSNLLHNSGSTFTNYIAVYDTEASADAWVACLATDPYGSSGKGGGLLFRADAASSRGAVNAHYQLALSGSELRWDAYDSSEAFVERVAEKTSGFTIPGDGDYIGGRVTGTGTGGTVFEYWDFGTTAPDSDPNNWGTPTVSLNYGDVDSGTPTAVADTGNYIGVRTYTSNGPTSNVRWANLEAWTP